MYENLNQTIQRATALAAELPPTRRKTLAALVDYVVDALEARQVARLTFICTHNSRRSHLGQLWAATAAAHYGVGGVLTFSGGTEATAFNPRAVAAVERAGFVVDAPVAGGDNPHYAVRFADDGLVMDCFSKVYDDAANPREDFGAVMTCSDADQNCPVILGATRLSLTYDDPKAADGTAREAARYDERSLQIASEMLYVFERVAARC